MGHIWMTSEGFIASISEDAGTRSGFALGESDILRHLGVNHSFLESVTAREMVRLSSVEYADAVGDLLFALGASDAPGMPSLGQRFLRILGDGWRENFKVEEILQIEAVALELCRRRANNAEHEVEIMDELMHLVRGKKGDIVDALLTAIGTEIAMNPFYVREFSKNEPIEIDDLFQSESTEIAMNPFYVREFSKNEPIEIDDLFQSESLPVEEGNYFDQRFIDYLARNPDYLKKINWRQFEGLTAEWFRRKGYEVELGPGRNDGGVDVRIWKEDESRTGPPTIIVQCKRYKDKVDVLTVKALYADVEFEKAKRGMLVTTSDITPNAQMTINVRNYPVTTANASAVREWISVMRKPGVGFLKFDDSQS